MVCFVENPREQNLHEIQMVDIFEPYEKLIEITIEGAAHRVPENNTILRCLQFLDIEKISDAELCWNGECLDCRVAIRTEGKERTVIACRTKVAEGMAITHVSDALR